MKRVLLILVVLFTYPQAYGEAANKQGVIMPVMERSQQLACCILFPEEGLTLYDGQKQPIGSISPKVQDENINENYQLQRLNNQGKSLEVYEYHLFPEVGYEVWALDFHDRRNGYIKVLKQDKDYWLKETDLHLHRFEALSWTRFLLREQDNLLGYYANEPGLNVRADASSSADRIITASGDLFEIQLTGEARGQWHKVIVVKSSAHLCDGAEQQVEYKKTGWIKLIDEYGLPNVRYYSRGC